MRYEAMPCHLCGYPIDYEAHFLDDRSFVVDEFECVRDGGNPLSRSNCMPAHRCCNAWRGCKDVTPQLRRTIRDRFEREILHKPSPQHRGTPRVSDGFF